MLCSHCGSETGSSKLICEKCAGDQGHNQKKLETWNSNKKAKVAENVIREDKELRKKEIQIVYADFNIRLIAFVIDFSILTLLLRLISVLSSLLFGVMIEAEIRTELPKILGLKSGQAFGFLSAYFVQQLAEIFIVLGLVYLIGLIYHTILESSHFRASVGKLMLGLRVGTLSVDKKSVLDDPSIGKILLRNIVKGFSLFPFFVGFFALILDPNESMRDIVFPACTLLSLLLIIICNGLAYTTPKKQSLHDIFSESVVTNCTRHQMDKIIQFAIFSLVILFVSQFLLYGQAIWGGEKAVHKMISLPAGVSSAAVNDLKAEFKDSVAFYLEEDKRIQVGFYRYELSSSDKDKIISEKSFWAAKNKKPDIVANMNFRKAAQKCNYLDMRGVSVSFYNDNNYFEFPSKLSFRSFARVAAKATSSELSHLSCTLDNKSRLQAKMQSTEVVNVNEERQDIYQWSLFIDTDLNVIPAIDKQYISFNSEKSLSSLALYYPEASKIEFGFFSKTLSFEEMGHMINVQSLSPIENLKPEAVLSVFLKEGSTLLTLDNVVDVEVAFNRGVGSLNFPGSKESQSFAKAGGFESLKESFSITGRIDDEERISGNFVGSGKALIENNDYFFDWNFVIDNTLYFSVKKKTEEDVEMERFPEITNASLGYVRIADKQFDFTNSIVKHDSQNNILRIALYNQELGEKERSKIYQDVNMQVGKKLQPLAQIFVELDTSNKLVVENIKKLTLSLYRQKFGDFYFPGNSDVKNIIYSAEKLKIYPYKITFAGTLQDGNVASLNFKGVQESSNNNDDISWNLKFEGIIGR